MHPNPVLGDSRNFAQEAVDTGLMLELCRSTWSGHSAVVCNSHRGISAPGDEQSELDTSSHSFVKASSVSDREHCNDFTVRGTLWPHMPRKRSDTSHTYGEST